MGALATASTAPAREGAEPHAVATRRDDAAATWIATYWPLLALVALAVVMSVVVRHVVYPAFSWNRDEATYFWQESVLRQGSLRATDGGFAELFHPWLTGLRDGFFFSQYTIGWPLVLLGAELLLGTSTSTASIAFGVALAVIGTYAFTRALTRSHPLALLAAALMTASPVVVVQSGVFLGYLFSLGLGLLFAAALVVGLRRDNWRFMVLAGALLGFLFITRPFDAVLWGAALGAYELIVQWGRWKFIVRAGALVACALAPFLVFSLLYNVAITGSPTQFPFTAKEPLDTFGFGARRLMPLAPLTDYTWKEALRGEGRNFYYFPQFLVGAYLGVVVAGFGLWLRRRERSTLALLVLIAAFPVGYFIFWGIRLSSFYAYISAPLYFLPLYVPICILIATVLLHLWHKRRTLAVVLCLALLVATTPFLASKIRMNHAISAAQAPWENSVEDLNRDSLVFVASSGPYLMHLNPYSRNTPDLDGRVLYATDLPGRMLDLIGEHRQRVPYLQLTSDPALADAFRHPNPPVPEITLIPLSVLHGRAFVLKIRFTVTSNEPLVIASLTIGDHVEKRTLATDARPGNVYETEWRIGDASASGSPGEIVAFPDAQGTFDVAVVSNQNAGKVEHPWPVQRYSYQQREGSTELLNPPRQLIFENAKGGPVIREVTGLRDLAVDVVANS